MQDRIISYEGDEYGLRIIHNHLLCLLEKLDSHCKKYQIPYSLAYGSMLGAVRNHGFIPWDDDVDIVMCRSDYDRFFCSLKKGETALAKSSLVKTPLFLPKLQELNDIDVPVMIDVYAADNVPDNRIKSFLKLCSIQFVKEIIKGRCNNLPGFIHIVRKVIANCLSFPFSIETVKLFYTKICIADNYKRTKRKGSYCTGHKSMGKYYPKEMFQQIEYVDFEDIKLPIMRDYHVYLAKEYGKDYMTPPSSSKRIPTHINQRL